MYEECRQYQGFHPVLPLFYQTAMGKRRDKNPQYWCWEKIKRGVMTRGRRRPRGTPALITSLQTRELLKKKIPHLKKKCSPHPSCSTLDHQSTVKTNPRFVSTFLRSKVQLFSGDKLLQGSSKNHSHLYQQMPID